MIWGATRKVERTVQSSNQRPSVMWRIGMIALVTAMTISSTALGSHLTSPTGSRLPIQGEGSRTGSSLPSHTPRPSQSAIKSEDPIETEVPILALPPTNEEPTVPDLNSHLEKPSKPHTTLGWNFLLHGQPKAAMAAYREALRSDPNSATAYLGLAMTLKSLGNVGTAKKALVRAVNLDPKLPSALVHLGYLYAEGHFGKKDTGTASRLFRQASQLGDPFASIALLEIKSGSQL